MMPEMFGQNDVHIVLRRVEDLVKCLGYEPEPQSYKLVAPPPIDDFETNRYIAWRFVLEENGKPHIYGARVWTGKRHDPVNKTQILLDVLRSVAFYVGGKERPDLSFLKQAEHAWKFREGSDTLLVTLLKMEWKRLWENLKENLSLRFSKSSGKTPGKYRRD